MRRVVWTGLGLAWVAACSGVEPGDGKNAKCVSTGSGSGAKVAAALLPVAVEQDYATELLPHQVWPNYGGEAIGLVFASGTQAWGPSYTWGRGLDPTGNQNAYRFVGPGSSPFAIYFKSTATTPGALNFLPQWQVPIGAAQPALYDAAMFAPNGGGVSGFGLTQAAHYARVKINDQRPNSGLHFVVTSAEALDLGDGYDADPVARIGKAKTRFAAALLASRSAFDDLYAAQRAAAEADQAGGNTTDADETEGIAFEIITGDGGAQSLRVTFIHGKTGTVVGGMALVDDNAPRFELQPAYQPQEKRTTFGVEYAKSYLISMADGSFDDAREFEHPARALARSSTGGGDPFGDGFIGSVPGGEPPLPSGPVNGPAPGSGPAVGPGVASGSGSGAASGADPASGSGAASGSGVEAGSGSGAASGNGSC